jgi:hypothetical protein
MQEILYNQEPPANQKPSRLSLLLGLLVLAAIAFSLWHLLKTPPGPGAAQTNLQTKMSAAEQAYAKNIRIENIALSRAENFIHQEVTILNADAINPGPQSIVRLSVTVEFLDELNQVVLRDTRPVLGTPPAAFGPGQSRHFEISFDHVPSAWNMQQPSVRVSYLQLDILN